MKLLGIVFSCNISHFDNATNIFFSPFSDSFVQVACRSERIDVNQFDGNSIHLMIHSRFLCWPDVGKRDFFFLNTKLLMQTASTTHNPFNPQTMWNCEIRVFFCIPWWVFIANTRSVNVTLNLTSCFKMVLDLWKLKKLCYFITNKAFSRALQRNYIVI